jgi:phage I-like protein
MAGSLERSSGVLSHDFYIAPTEQQIEMVNELEALQARYAELLAANPLFKAAVYTWIEAEHNDAETLQALTMFKFELDEEVDGMSKKERAENPDRDLHEMVKVRLKIAELKIHISASQRATGVNLETLVSHAA